MVPPEVQPCERYIPAPPEAIPTSSPDCFRAAFSPVDPAFASWTRDSGHGDSTRAVLTLPQEEEVPLALQLANKTQERGSVLAQIEHERVLVSDLRAKYEKSGKFVEFLCLSGGLA